jgi:ribosomal protein S27AE
MPDPACTVAGCPRLVWARGWCGTHYRRWQRTGTTDDPPPRTRQHETYAEYDRARRERDPEGYRAERTANSGNYRERNREAIRAKQRQREADPSWRERMRDARRAKSAVQHAIRTGRLTRPDTCEQCSGSGPIEAAHADYGRPLEVRWLCQKCHRRWDAADPKTRK